MAIICDKCEEIFEFSQRYKHICKNKCRVCEATEDEVTLLSNDYQSAGSYICKDCADDA